MFYNSYLLYVVFVFSVIATKDVDFVFAEVMAVAVTAEAVSVVMEEDLVAVSADSDMAEATEVAMEVVEAEAPQEATPQQSERLQILNFITTYLM
jgi:hypothetical protein